MQFSEETGLERTSTKFRTSWMRVQQRSYVRTNACIRPQSRKLLRCKFQKIDNLQRARCARCASCQCRLILSVFYVLYESLYSFMMLYVLVLLCFGNCIKCCVFVDSKLWGFAIRCLPRCIPRLSPLTCCRATRRPCPESDVASRPRWRWSLRPQFQRFSQHPQAQKWLTLFGNEIRNPTVRERYWIRLDSDHKTTVPVPYTNLHGLNQVSKSDSITRLQKTWISFSGPSAWVFS